MEIIDIFLLADPFGVDPFQQSVPFDNPFTNSDPFAERSPSNFKVPTKPSTNQEKKNICLSI